MAREATVTGLTLGVVPLVARAPLPEADADRQDVRDPYRSSLRV